MERSLISFSAFMLSLQREGDHLIKYAFMPVPDRDPSHARVIPE